MPILRRQIRSRRSALARDCHELSVRAVRTLRLRQVGRDQAFGGARNDVAGDQFADLVGGRGAGFDGCPHAADVAADDGGD